MIHPNVVLGAAEPVIGMGVFATTQIPRGTIVYIKDPLELEIGPDDPVLQNPHIRDSIEKYSYLDSKGNYIISWDIGKFVNHSCNSNTMSTGYGFEIAIRDIECGEQITDEYGLLNISRSFQCACGANNCRGVVTENDLDRFSSRWDGLVLAALHEVNKVEQPLLVLLDPETKKGLEQFLVTGMKYQSVSCLKYDPCQKLRPRACDYVVDWQAG